VKRSTKNGQPVQPLNAPTNQHTEKITMALIEARNKLMLLAGVKRADWENEPTTEQAAQIDATDTVVRFRWEPGNVTSYDLTYTIRMIPRDGGEMMQGYTLTWWEASAGKSIQWDDASHLHGPWFADKMGINAADADGLLLLLDAMGHSVSFCSLKIPPTPVTVEHDQGVAR